jgi:hypothetical protein
MTDTQLPDRPRYGHARLHGATAWDSLHMGADLTLTGTPDQPCLDAAKPWGGQVTVYPDPRALARFAREVLTFLGEDNGLELPPWQPAVNGTGKRPWFLARGSGAEFHRIPVADRYHFSARGDLVRYANLESAQRAADKLNTTEATS